jgi:peptidoglycan/xylan/chitin deacetylase (PgdA/CDA1 family)
VLVRSRTGPRLALACLVLGWLVIGQTGPTSAVAARVVRHGDRAQHVIALTFDDGVSPANCRRILATLVAEHVPATFFPIAEAMSLDPAFWRLVATVGDPVGDHTWSHPQMPTLGPAAQFTQIDRGRRVAESVLGRPLLRVFRPPYGAFDAATLTASAKAGFGTVLLWDVSDRDTSPHGTVAEMRSAAELGTNGSVVLMHCGPNATPYLLSDVIAFYRAHGFRFVTVPQLLGIAWSPGPTRALTAEQILGGLEPLPPSSSGGPITGPNGYSPPPGAPTASPTARPTATPTARPPATPTASPTATAAQPTPEAASTPSAEPTEAPTPAAPTPTAGPASTGPLANQTVFAALAGLAIVAVTVGSLVLARRVRER